MDYFEKPKEPERIKLQCPICHKNHEFNDEGEMYRHVDECINCA